MIIRKEAGPIRFTGYSEKQSKAWPFVAMIILLGVSPLAGILYLDLPITQFLEFPPRTKYVVHAAFSWPVFLLLVLFVAGICLPFIFRFVTFRTLQGGKAGKQHSFPSWGWLGIGCVLVFWFFAWNRFLFFAPLQRYTFTPLWLGYILVVNGLTYRRQGSCLLCSRSLFFLLLFPASTLFWWYFEYLNRFVQNWYYIGGANISTVEYIIHASICFSTVLPAVLSTYEFLHTFPRLTAAFVHWHHIRIFAGKRTGLLILAIAVAFLSVLAVFPDHLFPLVWISPFLVILGIQLAAGRESILVDLENGDWRYVVIPALAGLVCGFFWEMWNWRSLAHWEYSVPFVNRFHIFSMPFLGYAGYIPFGVGIILFLCHFFRDVRTLQD